MIVYVTSLVDVRVTVLRMRIEN